MRKILGLVPLLLMLPACGLFVGGPSIATASSVGCSTLLDPEWEKGVEGADLPSDDTIGAWIVFGDQQTGKLDVANDRTKAAIGIVKRCEERDAKALRKAKGGALRRIFGAAPRLHDGRPIAAARAAVG